jgi:hypothetical protein
MATTTQRFRRGDADWTPPTSTTKITTRSSPLPKIPRDEQVRIARPLGGGVVTRRPTPLDLRLAQAKSTVRLVSNDHDVETLRDPEIVDLAGAPRNWTARRQACPPCPPRQPPPVPPKPRRAPPPSVASRQSEMSFGILDYYIHDPSPAQSPSLPVGGTTPVVGDTAIERFDFGLGERRDATRTSDDAKSGADDDEMQLIPLSPRPFEEDKSESPPKTNRKKKQYSLFPAVQEVTPSSNRLAQVINESPFVGEDLQKVEESTPHRQQESSWRPRLLSGAKMTNNNPTTRHRTDTISTASPTTSTQMNFPSPTTTVPSPSYHPRKSSRSLSIDMNNTITTRLPSTSISSSGGSTSNSARGSSSTTSGRTRTISNPHHIPLRILSSSSSATTATANTTSRSSVSTSPGSTLAGQQKPLLSRWSEDTALASPTTAAHALATGAGGAGCRASFGSLLMGDGGLRTGEVYPDCFFEDDDDDDFARPLRRSRRMMGRGGQRVRGWKWFFCCGRKG